MDIEKIKAKVISAIQNNKLNLKNGDRSWYQYYISINELTWARNNHNGFIIYIYENEEKKNTFNYGFNLRYLNQITALENELATMPQQKAAVLQKYL